MPGNAAPPNVPLYLRNASAHARPANAVFSPTSCVEEREDETTDGEEDSEEKETVAVNM
jgi:hypothetical protein